MSNMMLRVVTVLTLLPVVIWASVAGGLAFTVMTMILIAIGTVEYFIMASGRASQGSAIIGLPTTLMVIWAFHIQSHLLWIVALVTCVLLTLLVELIRHPGDWARSFWQVMTTLGGVFYVGLAGAVLVAIRSIEPGGMIWLFAVFGITWGTDTFAYIGGRLLGRHKLWPRLSPNKTVEGAVIGALGGTLTAGMVLALGGLLDGSNLIVILIAPLLAIAGDLFESGMKRFFNIKDSRVQGLNVLPGHGGVLDRIDALIWVADFFFLYLLLRGIYNL